MVQTSLICLTLAIFSIPNETRRTGYAIKAAHSVSAAGSGATDTSVRCTLVDVYIIIPIHSTISSVWTPLIHYFGV